jgi:hypothetical protein
MRLPSRLLSAIPLSTAVLLGSVAISAGGCANRARTGEPVEAEVKQADIPKDAWAAIERETAGGTITELTRVLQPDGGVLYVAEWRRGNKKNEVEVKANGQVCCSEVEVARAELPEAFRKSLDEQTRTREAKTVRTFRASRADGRTEFEAEVLTVSKLTELKFNAAGEVIERKEKTRDGKPIEPAPESAPAAPAASSNPAPAGNG